MKKYIFLLLILIFTGGFLSAQAAGNYSVMSVDIGYGMGVDIENGGVAHYLPFGINFRVAPSLSVGLANDVIYYSGFPFNITMLKLKYDVINLARLTAGFGVIPFIGAMTPLIGAEFVPIKRPMNNVIAEFKLVMDYLTIIEPGNPIEHIFVAGIVMGIGF